MILSLKILKMANVECQGSLRSLPPGIIGNLSGYLTVEIGDVSFHRKGVKKFKIYISWWGEEDYHCMRSSATNIAHGERVTALYEVRTSAVQFMKYLKVCESVRIKVVDQENSKIVGFLTLHDLWLILSCSPYRSYFPIFDGQHQTIGELLIEFYVVFHGNKPESFENLQSVRKMFPDDKLSDSSSVINSQYSRRLISSAENKEYHQRMASDRFLSAKVDSVKGTSEVQEGNDCEEYIMDYILGKRMNKTEEKKAINCLKDWPALESVLEVLGGSSEFIKKSSSTKKETTTECRKTFLEVESHRSDEMWRLSMMGFQIYFKMISIEFTPTDDNRAYKSTFNLHNSGETYFIEYRFPSSNPKESEIRPWKEPPQGVRMSSKKQVGSVIFFNQSSIHCMSRKHQVLDEQIGTKLVFRILSRNLNQRVPSLVGEAQILLGDLLPEDEHACNLRKLPIFAKQPHNQKTKGMLVLRVKWVHIAKGLENDPKDESDQNMKLSDPNNDSPSSLHHINTPISDARITPEVMASAEKEVPLLHILLNVSEAYYCLTSMDPLNFCKRTNFNIYLVFRAFWNKGIPSKTHIVWSTNNPKFEYSIMVPLKITPYFINMCQENYMVVELWHKPSETGKDDLLGIAKVSLHQFYTSCKDPALFAEVMKLKHLVVSMNGNVKVYNPMDPSKICGWVNVLLALGSQDQIYSVRQSNLMCNIPNIKMKENTRLCASLSVHPEADTSNSSCKNQSLKLNPAPIEKYLQIHKITEFKELSKALCPKNSDCYIEYKIPNDQHVLKTLLKPVSSEIEFSSSPIGIKLPKNPSEEITFHVWCRYYDTNTLPRDRMVATAKLSLRRLVVADNDYCNKNWLQTFTLPLISVDPNDYSFSLGFLVVKFCNRTHPIVESCETEAVKSSNRGEGLSALNKRTEEKDYISSPVPKQRNQESQVDLPFCNSPKQGHSSNHAAEVIEKKRNEIYSEGTGNLVEFNAQGNNGRCSNISIPQEFATVSSSKTGQDNTPATSIAMKEDFNSSPISPRVVLKKNNHVTSNKTKSKAADLFKVHVEIEKAIHLKCDAPISGAYVTFWSYNKMQLWITSNVQPGDHPKWNWHCDTHLNGDLLIKSSEKLILQIWTTKSSDVEPNPSGDINVGSAAVNLRILIYGMPQVSGWFNILNSENKCCGQIKIAVTPAEDLSKFKQIAIKQWLSDYWKNNGQLIPSDLSIGRKDLYMEENGIRQMETKGLSKEESNSNLSENDDKNTPPNNINHLVLKSKIAELDEAIKQWKDNLAINEVDDFSKSAIAEVEDFKIQDTHPESPVSSQGSSLSMSSNISRKLSRVNPSTELKIFEKYVSDLIQNIQNNGSPSCISPMLEELFYHYEYGGSVVPGDTDKELIEKGDKIHSSVNLKPNQSGKDEFFCLRSLEEMAPKDTSDSSRVVNKPLTAILNDKSTDLIEYEYGSDFHSESEDGSKEQKVEKQGTLKIQEVDNFQDIASNEVTEVIDLPRQAPEGGNPVEDEIVLANRTTSQVILNSSSNMRNQNENSVEDDGIPILDALDVNQELERIEKIFNTTFTKE